MVNKLNHRFVFAGFGGQGLMFLGKLTCFAMMKEGYNVSYIPSYGPEMRGGTANCHVCVSYEPIASPLVERATAVIVMNQPSFDKFAKIVKKEGYCFANSSLVLSYDTCFCDCKIVKIDATKLASGLGNTRVANMIMYGKMVKELGFIDKDKLLEHLKTFLEKIGKEKFYLINQKAFLLGFDN